jgi:hypothetical protein
MNSGNKSGRSRREDKEDNEGRLDLMLYNEDGSGGGLTTGDFAVKPD